MLLLLKMDSTLWPGILILHVYPKDLGGQMHKGSVQRCS